MPKAKEFIMKREHIYRVESKVKEKGMFIVSCYFNTLNKAREYRKKLIDKGNSFDIRIVVEDVDVNPYEK
jgi:hypothetical protein